MATIEELDGSIVDVKTALEIVHDDMKYTNKIKGGNENTYGDKGHSNEEERKYLRIAEENAIHADRQALLLNRLDNEAQSRERRHGYRGNYHRVDYTVAKTAVGAKTVGKHIAHREHDKLHRCGEGLHTLHKYSRKEYKEKKHEKNYIILLKVINTLSEKHLSRIGEQSHRNKHGEDGEIGVDKVYIGEDKEYKEVGKLG